MQLDKTVTFTGHRPQKLGGFKEPNPIADRIKAELGREIDLAIQDGFDTFIAGGALGVDTWAAELVIEKKGYLIIARPFPSQHAKWPPQAQDRFMSVLARADEVVDVSPDPYAPYKMQTRNIWMVDRAKRIVAVFDGSVGGTANCVAYATGLKRDIRLITP